MKKKACQLLRWAVAGVALCSNSSFLGLLNVSTFKVLLWLDLHLSNVICFGKK